MQCFIGLTFSEHFLHYKKIDMFRKRFDNKYSKSNILQLSLLPPFELKELTPDIVESIKDEIEGHLLGLETWRDIEFHGIDFNCDKKGTVFLRPELPLELQYCQQSLWELILDNGGFFKKKRKPLISTEEVVTKSYLPIGRTKGEEQFEYAVLTAKEEFDLPFVLKASGISLFETVPGQWLLKEKLLSFENEDLSFNEIACLNGQIQALHV